jgi:aminopeptidase-like protein
VLGESLAKCLEVFEVLEENRSFVNLNPKCEPQLGRRGLYGPIGGARQSASLEMEMLWVLNLSDGGHGLLDIAERSRLDFRTVVEAPRRLVAHGLLREAQGVET